MNIVVIGEDASSFFKIVSLEAFSTVTVFSMSGALVRDGNASSLSVEDPLVGAGKADLVVPVPGGASEILGVHGVGGREDTSSFLKIVSLETFSAVTILSMSSAVVRNRHTSSLSVEDPFV